MNIKYLLKYLFAFVFLIMIYNLSLFLVSLPSKTNNLYNNCLESAITLKNEGGFYTPILLETIDNHSDALIVNESYSIDNENPIESYLLVRRSFDKDITKYIVPDQYGNLSSFYLNQVDENDNPIPDYDLGVFSHCLELYNFMTGKMNIATEYARYWHGYLLLFRPLLYIFNITQIRFLLFRNIHYSLYDFYKRHIQNI